MSASPGSPIYLDYNATTPVLPEVVDAMAAVMRSGPGNPSSLHARGRAARALIEESRETIAARLGGRGGDLVFTSGGSEANALAVLGVIGPLSGGASAADGAPRHAIVGAAEHPSTLEVYRRLEQSVAATVSWMRPGEDGRLPPSAIAAAVTPRTAIVSVRHACNETGVVEDIRAVAAVCREAGVPFHCDAVQSVGKLAVDLDRLGADLVALSAHKVYGPRGVGALWIRHGTAYRHPWGGGPQERGLRPGTEDLPGIVGFAAAVERIELPAPGLRDHLWARLEASCPGVVRNGSAEFAVPNTLNVSFPGLRAETLLVRLDLEGVQASSGSACSSGAREPSHVLRAMGLSDERVGSAVRFSLGRQTTAEEVDRAAEIVARCAREVGVASER